ncbi:MAG TPA: hypothetical protein VM389_05085, partial [Phycisphaerae bacterium]|nr:hypothetical protein [Phycisphaerae bacterium]
MNDVPVSDSKVSARSGGPRSDRVEVVKVLVLAIVSFLAGFGLVFLFLTPPKADEPDPPEPAGELP